jgi:uncharacterized membrane protein (DUF4010 family)
MLDYLLLAAISGLADVDALTLSMARLAGLEVVAADAANAILIAAAINTASKAAMAVFVGGAHPGLLVGIAGALAIGAVGITWALLH